MNRDRHDIWADILKLATKGAKITRLVYKANLNFSMIKNHLEPMIERDLIAMKDSIYVTTKRGRLWRYHYNRMETLYDAYEGVSLE